MIQNYPWMLKTVLYLESCQMQANIIYKHDKKTGLMMNDDS